MPSSQPIVLLGATGYIGSAFAREIQGRGLPLATLARRNVDYTRFDTLLDYLRKVRPALVVNAAGFTGKPNVDACETARADTLLGNTLLPQTVAHACLAAGVPWGHISSGCIYTGAKVTTGGQTRVEPDLVRPDLMELIAHDPDAIQGFTETDEPNFSFRRPPCSFYSGTKALAEEGLAGLGNGFIWRLRIPFDGFDNPRNYLTKIQRYPKVYENVNSITHRADLARVCVDLWERGAPYGIYNVTNPGFITSRQVVGMIERILKPGRSFEFWRDDEEFYRLAARTPRSNCVLDVSKLLATGVAIRPVLEALEDSLNGWKVNSL